MAYWIQKYSNKNNPYYKEFRCDYLSDIEKLPTQFKKGTPQENDTVSCNVCACGSECLCLEDSSVWVLGKETDVWKQI